MRKVLKLCLLAATSLGFGAHTLAAEGPPTARAGLSNSVLTSIALPPDLDFKAGRSLRMRKIRIEVGGGLPMHPHKDRPSVIYILSGTLTEFPASGGPAKPLAAGETTQAFENGHALANRGTVPVEFLEIDLPAPEQPAH